MHTLTITPSILDRTVGIKNRHKTHVFYKVFLFQHNGKKPLPLLHTIKTNWITRFISFIFDALILPTQKNNQYKIPS